MTFYVTVLFLIAEENCVAFCNQLYAAGTETTSTALTWGLLYMCLYPEILKKVQQEIDDEIGEVLIGNTVSCSTILSWRLKHENT